MRHAVACGVNEPMPVLPVSGTMSADTNRLGRGVLGHHDKRSSRAYWFARNGTCSTQQVVVREPMVTVQASWPGPQAPQVTEAGHTISARTRPAMDRMGVRLPDSRQRPIFSPGCTPVRDAP